MVVAAGAMPPDAEKTNGVKEPWPRKIYYPNLHWGILRHLGLRKIVPRTVRGVVDVKSSHVLPVGLGT